MIVAGVTLALCLVAQQADVQSLLAAALREVEAAGELRLAAHPSLTDEVVAALAATERQLEPFSDWSWNHGVPPPGVLLVERATVARGTREQAELLKSLPASVRRLAEWPGGSTWPILGYVQIWLGERAEGMACGKSIRMTAAWESDTRRWDDFRSLWTVC